jgi:hypothetical protein
LALASRVDERWSEEEGKRKVTDDRLLVKVGVKVKSRED